MKFLRSDFFSAGNIIIIIILILIAPFIVSAEKLMNESDAQKLQITSDSMLVNQADFSAHFKGNVMVYFKDYILKTEELIIIYNAKEQNIEKITIPKILKMVRKSPQEIVIADRAFFDKKLRQLILTGNVVVQKENHVLKTNQIIYDIKKL